MSVLGKMVSYTELWKEQIAMLSDAGDLLKQQLLDVKKENLMNMGAGSVCLQVMLTCQRKPDGDIYGFWEFGLNGHIFLLCPEIEKWEMVHPKTKFLKGKWEKDGEMIRFLKMMSMGDCKKWLKAFGEHLDRNDTILTTT
ncbi:UL16-binding protein 1-like [Sorex araneus]|uniref:UL16-binding protein 1-like n=1 Tax=Sorex araneus TaxID=42254 RepID=UPI00243389D7|nr:UL16-binding protein 1-like [Sorex araneus]